VEINFKIENIETIRLFGSYARGDQSQHSDYDILVILKKSQRISEDLEKNVKDLFDRDISISWYSIEKIRHLYKMGHLFAWHLHLESKALEQDDFLNTLGKPAEYVYSFKDISSLLDILAPIKEEVFKNPRNIVYETGLAYVCVRNIAICALPVLKDKISFSVRAPYMLNLNLNEEDYDLMMQCRYASTRGIGDPKIELRRFEKIFDTILSWSQIQLQNITRKMQYNGN
jgi:predicted nucleotidyltransferase